MKAVLVALLATKATFSDVDGGSGVQHPDLVKAFTSRSVNLAHRHPTSSLKVPT
jgi:hypothetical protein